jgi:hypothetical protein
MTKEYTFRGSELLGISKIKISNNEGKGRPYERFKGEINSVNGKKIFPVYAPTIPELKQYIRAYLKQETNTQITDLQVEKHRLEREDERNKELASKIEKLLDLDSRLIPGVLKENQENNALENKTEGGNK